MTWQVQRSSGGQSCASDGVDRAIQELRSELLAALRNGRTLESD